MASEPNSSEQSIANVAHDVHGMKGRRALITGAGTGIGLEIALEFARCGADVAFHYSHSAAGAIDGVNQARSLGVQAVALQADLCSLSETQQLAIRVEEKIGPIDILVNNAGITFNVPFLEMRPDEFQKLYDVNVRAGFFLTQQLALGMIERGMGVVCNITSVHGLQGASEHAAYAGTKGAIIAQTRALGIELAHRGVRVNAIAPGWIDVENHARAVADYDRRAAQEAAHQRVPAGRFGMPADVAQLALFLCSDAAAFIVGQTFVVDGGTTALMSLFSDFRAPPAGRYGRMYVNHTSDAPTPILGESAP